MSSKTFTYDGEKWEAIDRERKAGTVSSSQEDVHPEANRRLVRFKCLSDQSKAELSGWTGDMNLEEVKEKQLQWALARAIALARR